MYKLSSGLVSIDKKTNELITDMIHTKNKYKGIYLSEYSITVHSLDLLQYIIMDNHYHIERLIFEINMIKDNFNIAQQIIDEKTKNDIQYCIDIMEAHILSKKLAM